MIYPRWYAKRYRTVVRRRRKSDGEMVVVADFVTPYLVWRSAERVRLALAPSDEFADYCSLEQDYLPSLFSGFILVGIWSLAIGVVLGVYRILRELP